MRPGREEIELLNSRVRSSSITWSDLVNRFVNNSHMLGLFLRSSEKNRKCILDTSLEDVRRKKAKGTSKSEKKGKRKS